MVMFRGVADDLRLMDWLTRYIFPAEAKNVSAPFVKTATRLAALEMIRSGTTTFVDMYYFEDQIAEAAKEAGIRGVLGSTVIEVPGGAPDAKTVPDALANAERFLKRWAGDPADRPRGGAALRVPVLAGDAQVRQGLADRYQAPILIHLSEVADEVKTIKERYGKTSTEHLRDLGFLRKGRARARTASGSPRATARSSRRPTWASPTARRAT
jgi:5-methylthioadenosine/S-adenosylhomocysteine deaminase